MFLFKTDSQVFEDATPAPGRVFRILDDVLFGGATLAFVGFPWLSAPVKSQQKPRYAARKAKVSLAKSQEKPIEAKESQGFRERLYPRQNRRVNSTSTAMNSSRPRIMPAASSHLAGSESDL